MMDSFDREKLRKAGFQIVRIDERELKIRKYSDRGSWVLHSTYQTKKELKEAEGQLRADPKTIRE